MNFIKGSLFRRNTEPEELEPVVESGGGVLAVWGSPGCGKTVTAVKIAKHLASQKKNVALLLCDMTAPMMPCICPPSELECDKSLGSIFAAQRISVNLIKHNLTTVRNLSVSRKEANRILDDFQPDLVVGTGGYASYPVVHEAAKRGIKALGVSLSKEQIEYGQEWIKREGLEDLAELRVMDYRDVPERDFDGICSIGMMEHVGVKNYQSYFEEMFKLLKPMGHLLNHQITISHDKPHGKPGTDEFLDRYIFPDGDLGAPGFIESCIHDAGFNVVHQENLRQHYALTLHHWNRNLAEHWDEAVKEVGFERAKVWGLYMAACALNFEIDGIQVHQFLAVKPDRVRHPDGRWYPLRQWWRA